VQESNLSRLLEDWYYFVHQGDCMAAKLKIKDASGWTMFIFGGIALLLGLLGLLRPEALLSILGFSVLERAARTRGNYTLVFAIASSWLHST
jgi:hypothetical protein